MRCFHWYFWGCNMPSAAVIHRVSLFHRWTFLIWEWVSLACIVHMSTCILSWWPMHKKWPWQALLTGKPFVILLAWYVSSSWMVHCPCVLVPFMLGHAALRSLRALGLQRDLWRLLVFQFFFVPGCFAKRICACLMHCSLQYIQEFTSDLYPVFYDWFYSRPRENFQQEVVG